MSPEEKFISDQMFFCEANRCRLLPSACMARQKIAASEQIGKASWKIAGNVRLSIKNCLGCAQGKGIEKMVKRDYKSKECLKCGVFFQPLGSRDVLCADCKAEKDGQEKPSAAELKDALDEAAKPGPEQVERESKICNLAKCGKTFYRADDETNIVWAGRKYCSPECRLEAEKQRDKERGHRNSKKKKPVKFNLDRCREVAESCWTDIEEITALHVEDVKTLDMLRAYVLRAGQQAYKKAAQDFKVAS